MFPFYFNVCKYPSYSHERFPAARQHKTNNPAAISKHCLNLGTNGKLCLEERLECHGATVAREDRVRARFSPRSAMQLCTLVPGGVVDVVVVVIVVATLRFLRQATAAAATAAKEGNSVALGYTLGEGRGTNAIVTRSRTRPRVLG